MSFIHFHRINETTGACTPASDRAPPTSDTIGGENDDLRRIFSNRRLFFSGFFAGVHGGHVQGNQLGFIGELLLDAMLQRFHGDDAASGHEGRQANDVGRAHVADFLGDLHHRHVKLVHVVTATAKVDQRAVDEDDPALFHRGGELLQRGAVHGHQVKRVLDDRRADRPIGHHHGAIRRATAHLRAVGRHPSHLEAFLHGGVGQDLADQQNPLAAESGKLDFALHGPSFMPALCSHPAGSSPTGSSRPIPRPPPASCPSWSGRC
ncbi:hypothetical protein DESC_260054 [Desulfosarcina cetonica]|nr:hypothetical protein DESC_260054 [Desulfosarcina cetonica]